MYTFKTLEITGYGNQKVSNTFFRQQEETRQLAIVLPGVGYTCQMPLLYYASRTAIGLGMDALWVEYDYIRRPEYHALPAAEKRQWLLTDVETALRIALAQRSYDAITLIGKSLGTVAISRLVSNDSRLAASRIIWLTPVLSDDKVRAQIKARKNDLIVLGTADHYYDQAYVAQLMATNNNELLLVEGADHSMEIQGNAPESVAILGKVTGSILTFLSG
jgi:predicted alpha/beta-hydrolase family hydrolase